jgi:hypothetical protein
MIMMPINPAFRYYFALLLLQAIPGRLSMSTAFKSAMITLGVRSFAGSKFLPFEFDPDDKVSDVKEKIAKSPLCKGAKPMLEYNGLELADGRTLSYYGVKEPGVLRICE